MQHHFDTAIACKFGMLEAVIINHFEFWLEHNEKNGTPGKGKAFLTS